MSTTLFKRHAARGAFGHSELIARQGGFPFIPSPGEEEENPGGNPDNGGNPGTSAEPNPGPKPSSSPSGPSNGGPGGPGNQPSSTRNPNNPPTSARPPPASSTKPPPPPAPSTTSERTTSTSTTTPPSTSSQPSSTSSDSSTSSVPSTTSRVTTSSSSSTPLTTPTANFNGGVNRSVTPSFTPSINSEPTETASEASGAINTGPIVGGIAGGIAAVAILAFLIAFLVRRHRSRVRESEFDTSQFRRSAMMLDGDAPASRPMTFFGLSRGGHHPSPSMGSTANGPNMAGQGAFQPGEKEMYNEKAYPDNTGYGQQLQYNDYGATNNYNATPAPALQARQQYTYGQSYHDDSDHGHGHAAEYEPNGAYSAQPQVQGVYNLQAYGDYHAYQPEPQYQQYAGAHAVSQDATRQTGQPHVAQGRKSLNEEDAYGGI